jgi:precorrin-4 methylase
VFLDLGTRRGRGQLHAAAAFYPRKDPVPIVQESGWSPGTVWTGVLPSDHYVIQARYFTRTAVLFDDTVVPEINL